jgi:hypothetical protein
MKILFLFAGLMIIISQGMMAQSNITLSNPIAKQILLGNYDPAQYTPSTIINSPDSILHGIINRVSRDTLIRYLLKIDSYHNRNSGSDTISENHGIGAVRRWICKKFSEYSAENENRLVLSYLDFKINICLQMHHRNVLAILPGMDTTQKDILVLEGHYDTRCEGLCDTACYSPGMDDNGSGTVLVMELARIMSRYAFDHTIVFACVTGEDEGLYGSTALANYLFANNVKVRACLNNDVVGGIICGQTASPPGCPGLNAIDSTHVRIFSNSSGNDSSAVSPHKQLARYIKMHQEEMINPLLSTPMTVSLMILQDRTGRSGDQIPFVQKGYTAIRFTEANEDGNGQGLPPDRQHSTRDILGLDTSVPPDGIIDSFFVDPGYLGRNTIMNGVNLGWLANAPPSPTPDYRQTWEGVEILLHGEDSLYQDYCVGVRSKGSGSLYFDSVYRFNNTNRLIIPGPDTAKKWHFCVSNVKNKFESLFSPEYTYSNLGIYKKVQQDAEITMGQNHPNPFRKKTEIEITVVKNAHVKDATMVIRDSTGKSLIKFDVDLKPGVNKVTFKNTENLHGFFTYSLCISGRTIKTGKMSIY